MEDGPFKENDQSKNEKEEAKEKSGWQTGFEALAIIPQLSLSFVIPIVLGAFAGQWIDRKLNTGVIFFLIFLLLGIAGGTYSAYRQFLLLTKKK